ncbi:hypothetical protein C8A03DRAFT_35246 [Achaetomium macrosporum]|uniref:Uncharacterized protein n=1 Tax=Achaetomium macrosporum TaxID=79813 RepID=A0AAN7C7E5_9PEZI|nr:hypothetical protein C8A03DRAFT_35246 [Achaetomium macrosporum]
MAPLRNRPGLSVRGWANDDPRLLRTSSLNARQGRGDDEADNGGRRFRFGNNNGNNNGNNDGNDDSDRNGRGGGFSRSGGRGRVEGNGRGKGDGNGNGNRDGNENGDDNANGNRNSNGNGGSERDSNGNDNDNDNGNGRGDRESGRGNRRIGDGFGRDRDGSNGAGDANTTPDNSTETSPPPSPTSAPLPPPQTTASAETTPSLTVPAQTTADTSSSSSPGVILLQPAVTASPTPEVNPTVTAFIPLITPSAVADSTNLSGAGEEVESPNASSGVEPSASAGSTTTRRPFIPGGGRGFNNRNGTSNRVGLPQVGMDRTSERVLISVGSIGGFILVCFIVWMVWRTMRKPRKDGDMRGSGTYPRGVASRIPFFRRRAWQSLDESTTTQSPPPSYPEKASSAGVPPGEGFFGPEKVLQSQPAPQPWPSSTPNINPERGPIQLNNAYQPQPLEPRSMYGTRNPLNIITTVTDAPASSHQAQDSFSSNAAQFGAASTDDNNSPRDALQTSVSPASYYNTQSFAAQQFTAPYPIYRQPSRTLSGVSSLSSGFGDGDFVMVTTDSDNIITPPKPTTAAPHYTTRFSWMSQPQPQPQPQEPSQRNSSSSSQIRRRETVYTEASEDHPARFRSVASWVNQQTGRIRRAQQRQRPPSSSQGDNANKGVVQVPGNPGIPGIPNAPPAEPSFGMMMDDEERPRKVESVVGKLP